MFGARRNETVIAENLKIKGSLTAEGLVKVNGQIEGEINCTSLVVARKARVVGTITAEHIVIDGIVEGPIRGGNVVLKSRAHVVGDIHHTSLTIEKDARFEGRAAQLEEGDQPRSDRSRRKAGSDRSKSDHRESAVSEERQSVPKARLP